MAPADPTSPTPPVRLVIVDADRRVREGLSSLGGSSDQVAVVGEAGHPATALDLVGAERPKVVLIDPRLPEVDSGLALIRMIRTGWPDVVVLAMGWSDELEAACVAAGAHGFIPKTSAPNDFVDAVIGAGIARRESAEPDDGRPVGRRPELESSGPATRHILGHSAAVSRASHAPSRDGEPRRSGQVPAARSTESH